MLKNKFIGLYLISLVILFETTAWAADASPSKPSIEGRKTSQRVTAASSSENVPLPFSIGDLIRSDKSEREHLDKKISEANVDAKNSKPFTVMHINKNPALQLSIQRHLSARLHLGDLTQEQHSNALSKLAGYYDRKSLEDFLSVMVILSKRPKNFKITSEGKILLSMGLNEVRQPLAYVVDRPKHELFIPVLMNALRILGNNPGRDSGFATDFIIKLCINLANNEKKEGLLKIADVPYDEKHGWTKFFNGLSSLATNSLDKSNRNTFLASIETLKGLRIRSRTKPTKVEPTASAKSAPQTAEVEPIQNQEPVGDANTASAKTDNTEKPEFASKKQRKKNTAAIETAKRTDLATHAKGTKSDTNGSSASDDTSGKAAKPTDDGAADEQVDSPVSAKPTTTAKPTSSESATISAPEKLSWADQEVEEDEDEGEQEWQEVKNRSQKKHSGNEPSDHRSSSFRKGAPVATTSWSAKAATVSDQRPKPKVGPAATKPIHRSSANPAAPTAKTGTSKIATYAQALSSVLRNNGSAKSLPESMSKRDGRSEQKRPVREPKQESGPTEPIPPPAPEQPKAPAVSQNSPALPPPVTILEDSKAAPQDQNPQQTGPQPSAAYLNAMKVTPEAARKAQLEHLSLNGDIHAKSTYGRILQMEGDKKNLELVVRLYLASAEVPESTRYLRELVEGGRIDLNRFSEGRQFLNKHALSATPAPKTEANPAPTVPAQMTATTPQPSVAQPHAPHPLPPHDGCSPQALAVPQPNIEPIRAVLPQQTPPTAATPPVPRTFGPGISQEQPQAAAIPPVTQTLPQAAPPQPILLQTTLPQPRTVGYRLPEGPGHLIPLDVDPSEVFFEYSMNTANGTVVVRIPLIEFVRQMQF